MADMTYVVERRGGVPYLLARLHWPDTAEAVSPSHPVWKSSQSLFDKLHGSDGELVTEGDAMRLAQSWGAPWPPDDAAA